MNVRPVGREIYGPWLLQRHYARRIPPVQYAYGIWDEGACIGVVTYGPPASPQVCKSLIDADASQYVLELNRLCVDDAAPRNASSMLVGRSLAVLPRPSVVVSYADGAHGHVGYIYQATNFAYYGAAKAHDAEYESPEGQVVHPRTMAARGISNPTEWARLNGWMKREAHPKHRYVFICGSPRQRRKLQSRIKWHQQDYPKGDTRRYDASSNINAQSALF